MTLCDEMTSNQSKGIIILHFPSTWIYLTQTDNNTVLKYVITQGGGGVALLASVLQFAWPTNIKRYITQGQSSNLYRDGG